MRESANSEKVVVFHPNVYRLSAIKKASYKYMGTCHIKISIEDNGKIDVLFKPGKSCNNLDELINDFCNEVLDQDLRETVAEETAAIKNIILAQAFSPISLINPEADTIDYDTDPFGITR